MPDNSTPWRKQPRWECSIKAVAVTADGDVPCVVTDTSNGGARLYFAEAPDLSVGADLTLQLPDREPRHAKVRHVAGNVVGVAFAAVRPVET